MSHTRESATSGPESLRNEAHEDCLLHWDEIGESSRNICRECRFYLGAADEIARLTKVAHGLEAVIRRTCMALRGSDLASVAEEVEEQAVDVMMGEDRVAT